jgi:predicted RNA-binding protein YlqC (UPF0109 family)
MEAAAKAAAAVAAVQDDSGDELYDQYAAAKDSSRRVIGKQGRNTVQAIKRQYAIEARTRQRGSGT